MQGEEPPIYNFDFAGGSDNRYNFITVNGISYNVRFKPATDYVAVDEVWRNEFYEIVIELIVAPDPAHIPADRGILPTVVAIITDFFTTN